MAADEGPNPLLNPLGFWADQSQRHWKRSVNFAKHMSGQRAKVGQAPRHEIWTKGKATLYRYDSDQVTVGPPVLLIMSLVSRSFILDLQPGNSFVEHLREAGLDVFLLDWGVPDEDDADNDLSTYADELIPAAVASVNKMGGNQGVNLFGYCFGGVLSLIYAARHTDDPINSLMVMATPVDFDHMPEPLRLAGGDTGVDPEAVIDSTGNVPAAAVRSGFTMLTPTADLATVADFFERLDDDRFLESYQAMTKWTRSHIPFPGAAFRQTVELLQDRNGFVNGGLMLKGEPVDLKEIKVPFASVIAEHDHIVPADSATPLIDLVGSEEKVQMVLPAGHVGLIVGRGGRTKCMPSMSGWLLEHSEPLS